MKCCVPECGNKRGKWEGISFHSFPPDDSSGLSSWNTFCGLDPTEPRISSRVVCSHHFKKKDILNPRKRQRPRCGATPFFKKISCEMIPPNASSRSSCQSIPTNTKHMLGMDQSAGDSRLSLIPVMSGNFGSILPATNQKNPRIAASLPYLDHTYSVMSSERGKRKRDEQEKQHYADGAYPTR